MTKVTVSIVGGSGYTGAELLRLLSTHPDAEVLHVTSREFAGTSVADRLPNLLREDLEYEPPADRYPDSDVVFLCVPHTSAMGMVPSLLEGSRVIDLSADYRLADRRLYESVYGVKHTSPGLKAVYGLPELHHDEIAAANLVANPGCYATGAILALAPAVKEPGLIERNRIVIDAKSGTSGAGIKPTSITHHPECAQSIVPYRVTDHRHIAEIDQELSLVAGEEIRINFTPHLIPVPRGILTTCHTFPADRISQEDIASAYGALYESARFVRVRDHVPDLRGILGSNFCDIGFERDSRTGRLVIVSAIDNLCKGASGQAVQNMNIMFNLPEERGLEAPGIYP